MSHTRFLYHIVFRTKGGEPLIGPSWENELYKYLGGIVKGLKGIAIEINGMPDHVHLLVLLVPCDFAAFMRELKASSSKWAKGIIRNSLGSVAMERSPLAHRLLIKCACISGIRKTIMRSSRSRMNILNCWKSTVSNSTGNICGTDAACYTRSIGRGYASTGYASLHL